MSEFKRSGRCESSNCVEVSIAADKVVVRNSERPDVTEEFTFQEWNEFIEGVTQGHFNLQ